jgi:hypothetical protein
MPYLGQGVFHLDGRYVYLGESTSAAIQARYHSLVATDPSNGRKLPDANRLNAQNLRRYG